MKLGRFKLFHRNRYRGRILGPTSGVDRSQNFVVRPKSRRKISGLFSGRCSVWFFRLSSGWKVSSQLRSFGFCFGSELGAESEKTENKKKRIWTISWCPVQTGFRFVSGFRERGMIKIWARYDEEILSRWLSLHQLTLLLLINARIVFLSYPQLSRQSFSRTELQAIELVTWSSSLRRFGPRNAFHE